MVCRAPHSAALALCVVMMIAAFLTVATSLHVVNMAFSETTVRATAKDMDLLGTAAMPVRCRSRSIHAPGGKHFVGAFHTNKTTDHTAVGCGKCVQVTNVASKMTTIVQIMDLGASDHFALSKEAFRAIANGTATDAALDVIYSVVPCMEARVSHEFDPSVLATSKSAKHSHR